MTVTRSNETATPRDAHRPIVYWMACAALIALLLGWTAITVYGWRAALRQRADLDYSEGWHAYCAQQAIGGSYRVGSAKEPPHNVLPYPPLSYVLYGATGKLAGGSLQATRDAGRAWSLAFTVCAAGLIALLCRTVRVRWTYAVLASVVFLNLRSIQLFAVNVRPDAFALSLCLLAFWLGLRFGMTGVAGALLALAVFAKHSYVTAPAVMFWGLVIYRDWKALYRLMLGAVLATIAAIWISVLTMGTHWLDGPLLQGFHGAKPGQVLYLTLIACRSASIPLAVGLAAGLMTPLPRPARFVYAAAGVSFLLNVVAMVKPGASMNYLLEPTAFALVMAAYAMDQTLPEFSPRNRSAVWLAVTLALLLVPALESAAALRASLTEARNAPCRDEVIRVLREVRGPILATEAWMYFDAGHEPWLSPSDLVSAAVEGHIVPEAPLRDLIEARHFGAIAMTTAAKAERPLPKSWQDAIEQNYSPQHTYGDVTVYLPNANNVRKTSR